LQFQSLGAACEDSGDESTGASVLALKELTLVAAAQHEIMKLKEVIGSFLRIQLDSLIGFLFVRDCKFLRPFKVVLKLVYSFAIFMRL